MCRLRIRVPDQWWGDYLALLGAARIGERELLELGREVGWDTLERYRRATGSTTASADGRRDRAGCRPARSTVEQRTTRSPGVPDGIPIKVDVAGRCRRPGRIAVDLRDNLDCLPCGLNLSEV